MFATINRYTIQKREKWKERLDFMDVLKRLKDLMHSKGINEYKLSKLSEVPQSTINSMFRKQNNPTIYTLEKICRSLNITMSEFFRQEDENPDITDENLAKLISKWDALTLKQKEAILAVISSFSN